MSKMQRITAIAILALSIFGIWSSVTHSQDPHGRPLLPDDPNTRKSRPAQSQPAGISAEEKLVRDVYARLMRYQSAAIDEVAATNKKAAKPVDYLTFELRAIHSGPIQDIYAKSLNQMVTPRAGDLLTITPNHLSRGSDSPHAAYLAEWLSIESKNESADQTGKISIDDPIEPRTIAEMFARGEQRFVDVVNYTSYEVTVRLDGKNRTYRALVLYHVGARDHGSYQTEEGRLSKLTSVEILDNVTPKMNTVLRDASPYARAPWKKYSKSDLYLAVVRTIRETKEAGKPLIPADAPIGYLPGDDVSPSKKDTQTLRATAGCPELHLYWDASAIGGLVLNVVVGQKLNLSAVGSNAPQNIQWSIDGTVVQNYVANSNTGTVTQLGELHSDAVSYYYVLAGQRLEVSVSADVDGAFLTDTAWFNVAAPNPNTPTVTLPTNGQLYIKTLGDCSGSTPGPNMVFGSISGPNANCTYSGVPGIEFSPPTTSTPPGSFFFVQLVTGDTVTYTGNTSSGGTMTCTATNTPGLDGAYPYQNKTGQTVNDAPFSPLLSTYAGSSRNFAATMYLMWQSNTTESIPVPMGSVNWSISASTFQTPTTSSGWSDPNGSGSAQQFAPASGISSFPQWTGRIGLANANCH